tara:strand:+ start:283 stop:1851 length:1569 start_codon:yes stop_codon:yes gene_type:complete
MATNYPTEQERPIIQREVGVDLELLLDKIADILILDESVNPTLVANNQKTIKRGLVSLGRTNADRMLLYQKDIKANKEDLNIFNTGDNAISLQDIANQLPSDINLIDIAIGHDAVSGNIDSILISSPNNGGASYEVYDVLVDLESGNPLNISQFINVDTLRTSIDPTQAHEYLDTNIFELLPSGDTRQARIIRFFQELNVLLPPQTPQFDITGSVDGPDGRVDRAPDGTWDRAENYSQQNSISYAQDNPDASAIDEEDAFIHRLKSTANDTNSTRTIEDIYNTILPYLSDILEEPLTLEDERPEYQNQSDGYLKFRNLNQGIIIRNANQEYIQGLNPELKSYLNTGFTISMWVRFLDKTSTGTLFNFGNCERDGNPSGFKLETIVNETNTRRYLRLVVLDELGLGSGSGTLPFDARLYWYDSHIGNSSFTKVQTDTLDSLDTIDISQYTEVPINFTEWYFICASYNPLINELESDFNQTLPEYWYNNVTDLGEYISNSGIGNRCKVEIISRSDLLRARGFKV